MAFERERRPVLNTIQYIENNKILTCFVALQVRARASGFKFVQLHGS